MSKGKGRERERGRGQPRKTLNYKEQTDDYQRKIQGMAIIIKIKYDFILPKIWQK